VRGIRMEKMGEYELRKGEDELEVVGDWILLE